MSSTSLDSFGIELPRSVSQLIFHLHFRAPTSKFVCTAWPRRNREKKCRSYRWLTSFGSLLAAKIRPDRGCLAHVEELK
jgi:hypothetical protein